MERLTLEEIKYLGAQAKVGGNLLLEIKASVPTLVLVLDRCQVVFIE